MSSNFMKISELIERTGLPRDTLRYYEREGVISAPKRLMNGYRDYSEISLAEIRFVQLGQSVGLPLKTIKQAIPHITNPKPGCPLLRAALVEQLQAIDSKMAELKTSRAKIKRWLDANQAAALAKTK
jgi:DNA-binding transcriptional MerR regulator